MPTPTYTPLANLTLSSSAASVTFSSISQAYRDLVLVVTGTTAAAAIVLVRFNSDSGSNYNDVYMQGDGSATASGGTANNTQLPLRNPAWDSTDLASNIVQIFDYSATDKHKSVISRGNRASTYVNAMAGRWASTSAITSVYIYSGSTFVSGSTFALYGIAA